jgi:hypothetical protein
MGEGDNTVKSRSQNKSIMTQNAQSTVPHLNLNQSHVKTAAEIQEKATPAPTTPKNDNFNKHRRGSEYHTARKVVNISNLIKEKEEKEKEKEE